MPVRKRNGSDSKQDDQGSVPEGSNTQEATPTKTHESGQHTKALDSTDHLLLGIVLSSVLLAFSLVVRCWNIEDPATIVFDEIHFGRFAAYYLKGKFFFDVHPPLAKMLLALAGYWGGLKSDFMFHNIGEAYSEEDAHAFLRLFCAGFGAFHAPLVYYISRELKLRPLSAVLAGLCAAADLAMIIQSRLILLDAIFIFFLLLTVLWYLKMANARSFTAHWWCMLTLCGTCLGATLSVKFVGVFTVALIGTWTAQDLWMKLGDLSQTAPVIWRHVGARIIGLIVVPISLYIALFAVHLGLLESSGPGDVFMSPGFQATLRGNIYSDTPPVRTQRVVLGSNVTLRNSNRQCYLHSHDHRYPYYPTGDENGIISSHQQQITCNPVPHASDSVWFLADPEWPANLTQLPAGTRVRQLHHGQTIKLIHIPTLAALNSHDVAGPVTPYAQEVSGYQDSDQRAPRGEDGHMPRQDLWVVEVSGQKDPNVREKVTSIRLKHKETSAYLQATNNDLPEWGFGHGEVVASDIDVGSDGWFIANCSTPLVPGRKLEPSRSAEPKLGFWGKFFESHFRMFEENNKLKGSHVYGSRPLSWLVNKGGISYFQAKDRQIFLIGNPVIWWSGLASVVLLVVLQCFWVLRRKRRHYDVPEATYQRFQQQLWMPFSAWMFHFLPFLLMQRQLFLHHYLPAVIFSFIFPAVLFERITPSWLRGLYFPCIAGFCVAVIASFVHFAPLGYGFALQKAEIEARQWTDWRFQVDFSTY